jgi:DNA repair protein SbcD/Mre11
LKQVKIMHCADMHLGAELKTLGRRAVTRRVEMKRTFMNILKLCQVENIQLLLIAGDLFDNVHVQENMLEEVRDGFASLTDTIVAISPGNHDPLTEDSPYLLKDFWPENVIIFKSKLEKFDIESLGVHLWGAAFTGTYEIMPLLQSSTIPNVNNGDYQDEFINICIIHGDFVAPKQKSNYNPITETQLRNSRMDYVAMGHIHKQTEVLKAGDTYYAYSGCPEGRGFDELDEKGVYLGTISKGLCRLEFKRTCQRMNVELHVDIAEALNSKMATDIVRDKMIAKYGESFSENLYKVILEGMISNNASIDCDVIKNELSEIFFVKIKDHTTIEVDFDTIDTETTLRNIFIRKMLERINDAKPDQKESLNTALKLGMKAFSGEVKYNED